MLTSINITYMLNGRQSWFGHDVYWYIDNSINLFGYIDRLLSIWNTNM